MKATGDAFCPTLMDIGLEISVTGDAPSTWWLEARDAAQHPTHTVPIAKTHATSNVRNTSEIPL